MKKIIYVLLTLALLTVFGCSGDEGSTSTSNSITAPNPNPFQPKGTVTGVLTDRVTGVPLVNATVMIMGKVATTDSFGGFTITDIPANTPAGNEPADAAARNTYTVVINLSAVNSAIDADAANTTKAKYPPFAYSTVQVKYDSLGDTTSAAANSNVSNHDTPVDGFVANMAPTVGKLDANLKIQVVDSKDQVAAGATVMLYSTGGATNATNPVTNVGVTDAEVNTTTGNLNHYITTATTDAEGIVTFSNVEAGAVFRAVASIAKTNAPGSNGLVGTGLIVAPSDGGTRSYLNQQDRFNIAAGTTAADGVNDAIKLASVDLVKPLIIETTPATGSDIASDAVTIVKFKFSEPLLANNYAKSITETAAQGTAGGLWKDVSVNFDGPKAGNLPYTLSWDTSYTELSVTFASVAASKYTVSIQAAAFAADKLADADNATTAADSNGNATVTFTTSGGNTVVPPSLVRTNDTTIDWAPVANAYKYRVYVSRYVNGLLDTFGYADQTDTRYTLTAAILDSTGAAVFTGFNSNQIPVTYKVKVITMGTKNVEAAGAASTETILNKTNLPKFTATNFAGINNAAAGTSVDTTFTITSDSVMNRFQIQTVGNWSIGKTTATLPATMAGYVAAVYVGGANEFLPSVKSVSLNAAGTVATVVLNINNTSLLANTADLTHLTLTYAGADVQGNTIASTSSHYVTTPGTSAW